MGPIVGQQGNKRIKNPQDSDKEQQVNSLQKKQKKKDENNKKQSNLFQLQNEIKDLKECINGMQKQQNMQGKKNSKICSKHNEKTIDFFCNQCQDFLCSQCILQHSNHMEKINYINDQQLSDYLQFSIGSLDTIKQSLKSEIHSIDQQKEEDIQKIIQQLPEIQQIQESCKQKIDKINEEIQKIDTSIQEMNQINKSFNKKEFLIITKIFQNYLKEFKLLIMIKILCNFLILLKFSLEINLKMQKKKETLLFQLLKIIDSSILMKMYKKFFQEENKNNHLIIFILEIKIQFQCNMQEYSGIRQINIIKFKI